jgi:hypothetical protein
MQLARRISVLGALPAHLGCDGLRRVRLGALAHRGREHSDPQWAKRPRPK